MGDGGWNMIAKVDLILEGFHKLSHSYPADLYKFFYFLVEKKGRLN